MMEFSVRRWSAWAPGRATPAAWRQWLADGVIDAGTAVPDVRFVEPMLRRRLSRLSRLSLAVAHDCLAGAEADAGAEAAGALVFASRHGELHTTVQLLEQLAVGEALSPMAFALSVHNTAAGLHALAAQDRAPSLAVAAGADTLAMALTEAALQAAERAQPVLLVYAEENLPMPFGVDASQHDGLALALLLAPAGAGGMPVRFTKRAGDAGATDTGATNAGTSDAVASGHASPARASAGLALVRALLDGGGACWPGEQGQWHWQSPVAQATDAEQGTTPVQRTESIDVAKA